MSRVSRMVALAHQDADLIVGPLPGKAFLAEELDDFWGDAQGVSLVEGEDVVLSDRDINDTSRLVHECEDL